MTDKHTRSIGKLIETKGIPELSRSVTFAASRDVIAKWSDADVNRSCSTCNDESIERTDNGF